jgi:pimeloyl-ACP methyl ester carboxylesterase
MEMHAIQSKQASMSSGCIVGKPEVIDRLLVHIQPDIIHSLHGGASYLRKHLGKEKIIIVGHSLGSNLGTRMARARPELFYAYVGTGQVADATKNYTVTYEALLKKAKTLGDQQAIDELSHVGRPPSVQQWRWRGKRLRAGILFPPPVSRDVSWAERPFVPRNGN